MGASAVDKGELFETTINVVLIIDIKTLPEISKCLSTNTVSQLFISKIDQKQERSTIHNNLSAQLKTDNARSEHFEGSSFE